MASQTQKVKLVSTEGTGVYYTVTKSKLSGKPAAKLRLRKYDKKLRKHVEFKEDKVK